MARVRTTERVLTEYKVEATAPIQEFFTVEDFIQFGKELEKAQAPRTQHVTIVTKEAINDGTFKVKSLGVYWSEDLINGEPAPQAEEKPAEENPTPGYGQYMGKDQDWSLGPIKGRTG